MFRNISICLFLLLVIQTQLPAAVNTAPEWVKDVGANSSPDTTHVLKVNDYGAIGNGLILATEAIQQAIDQCHKDGGGRVVFDPGVYLTGAIYLRSNVNLHVGESVEIRGIIGLEQYPDIYTRVAGIMMDWPSGIINILDQENVAISGKGVIHAQGRYHWEQYWKLRTEYTPRGLRWASDYDCKRVRTILVSDSKNVTIKDLTLKQAGFWTVHLLFSSHVTVDGITINNNVDGHGPSTDGIDIDSSEKILVQHCVIDCNDDNVCLKAGRDADGLRVNRPTEYVVIRDCISLKGGGLVTIGSETSGWIRHVLIENLEAYGTKCAIRFKSALTRGGGLSDIHVNKLKLEEVEVPLAVTLNWNPSYSYASLDNESMVLPDHWIKLLEKVEPEKGIPRFRDVRLNNISATGAKTAINVSGIEDSYIENFSLNNISISCQEAGRISYTRDWTFNNVNITSETGEGMILKDNINLITEKSKF